jgi:Ca2+-binding RTX toxin-like protein
VEAVLLDPTQDGIAQITATLASRSNISGVHLIGHGSSGSLRLGSTVLNQETIVQYADSLNQWRAALTEDADLLLYGCNVAADSAGQAFVNQLSQLTAADVAASDDLTGNAALGGDWLLEYATGLIESPLALQVQAMEAYQQVLANFEVSNSVQLFNAINQANRNPGLDRILLTGNITLTSTLPTITDAIEVVGTGAGATINGANGVNRIFKVSNTTASFSNLTLQNGVARGATGIGGGGGGLGAGGALFAEFSTIDINDVQFRDNLAQGGDSTGTAGRGGNGGNLGIGGDNGTAGGIGGGFEGSSGGAGGTGGLNGFQANRNRRGGDGGNGANGDFGEGGGAGGGGGGGQSVFFLFSDLGGNGGTGGAGGRGGFGGGSGGSGGGGGGADTGFDSSFGGNGGSGISGSDFGGRGTEGANGLAGGPDLDVFGGAGGVGGRGGGGAGLGGAIFARNSNVTIRDSLFVNNRGFGGAGGSSGQGRANDIFSFESPIRLQGNQFGSSFRSTEVFGPNAALIPIRPPIVSLTARTATVQEGGITQFIFSLTEPADSRLQINFRIEGSATTAGNPDADHTLQQSGFVTILQGARSFFLTVPITDDTLPEPTETLTLRLQPGPEYELSSTSFATVQIQDNDVLFINGAGGDDRLNGTAAAEQINGNDGNDTIDGNGGIDFIFGDAGDDRIIWDSGDGNDIIDGGEGNDTLVFNCSNQGDRLIVQQLRGGTLQLLRDRPTAVDLQARSVERLEINCLPGNDRVEIRDTTTTGTTFIRVSGGSGQDVLTGIGATAELELVGGDGDDVLTGGRRNDQLRGGNGRDSFVFNTDRAFNTADLGIDRILDFVRGSDRIVLDQTTFGAINTSQIAIVADDAIAATSAGLITYSRATGNLFFNQNGAAAGFGTGGQFATFQGNPALTVNDFQIVA